MLAPDGAGVLRWKPPTRAGFVTALGRLDAALAVPGLTGASEVEAGDPQQIRYGCYLPVLTWFKQFLLQGPQRSNCIRFGVISTRAYIYSD